MFVRLAEVSFSYSDSIPILRDVSMQLAPGWTGVVGPNGAGKTTLIRLISGELEPARGPRLRSLPRSRRSLARKTVFPAGSTASLRSSLTLSNGGQPFRLVSASAGKSARRSHLNPRC
jgi:ABC-type multidrug transport system ATPase subunit